MKLPSNLIKTLFLPLLLCIFSFSLHAQRQTENSFRSRFGPNALVGYYAYVPTDYAANPSKNYPILIYLHGAGDKAWNPSNLSNLHLVKTHGPSKLIDEGQDFPFIVISPQCPFTGWDDVTSDNYASFQTRPGEFVDEILEKMKTLYRVDANRIYITGISMGAASTWEYIQAYPHKVAASIPIAGWSTAAKACSLATNNVAVWTFQGELDGGNGIIGVVNKINACNPAPNPRAKATVYAGVGHDAWTQTYNNTGPGIAPDNIYDWLMRHSKGQITNNPPVVNAGADKNHTLSTNESPADSLKIIGSATDDNSVSSVLWSKVSGPSITIKNSNQQTVTLKDLKAGTYIFRLTAQDVPGLTAFDEVTLTVNPAIVVPPPTTGPIVDNTDWKLRATSVTVSDNDPQIIQALTSGADYTSENTLPGNTTESISVRLPVMTSAGMFTYSFKNSISGIQVNTYQSTDGVTWETIKLNNYTNGRGDDLQKADIPLTASNKWFRISFVNTTSSSATFKEVGMYQFKAGVNNQYFLFLGASITESAGGHTEWVQTIKSRINSSLQPVIFNWSVGGETSAGIKARTDGFLAQHPNAYCILVEAGGNDVSAIRPLTFEKRAGTDVKAMENNIRYIIQAIKNANKMPLLSRLSYRNYYQRTSWMGHDQPPVNGGLNQENGSLQYNYTIDKIIKEMTPMFWDSEERRGYLDFYPFTLNNQSWLVEGDGVHFYGSTAFHIREFWADYAFKYLYTGQKAPVMIYNEYVPGLTAKAETAVAKAELSLLEKDIWDARILVDQVSSRTNRLAFEDRLLLIGTATAPSITLQPLNKTVLEGSSVTFSVAASGAPLPTYQWKKNNIAISGAVQNTYSYTPVLTDNNSVFTCTVSNASGTVTSSGATLLVNAIVPLPVITQQPANLSVEEGLSATFTVVVSGSGLTYQWKKNNLNISGAVQSSYTYTSVLADNNSVFTCTISNVSGSVTSTAATLLVSAIVPLPVITQQPANLSVEEGLIATFTVVASGSGLTYQWQKDGVNISGAVQSTYTLSNIPLSLNGAGFKCLVTNVKGTVISNIAVLTVTPLPPPPPTVTVNGLTGTYYNTYAGFTTPIVLTRVDATINFDWLALSPDPVVNSDNFTVRWTGKVKPTMSNEYTFYLKSDDGARLWVNNQLLVDRWVNQVASEYSGKIVLTANQLYVIKIEYFDRNNGAQCKLSWSATSLAKQIVPSSALFTESIAPPTLAPAITSQPISTTVFAGSPASFSVTVSGTAPFTYQWQKAGMSIAGATQSTFNIASPSLSDNNSQYRCVITNSAGTVTSATAVLLVNPVPVSITQQPSPATVLIGSSTTFSVFVSGTAPFTYQWLKNNDVIAGATESTYSVVNALISDNNSSYSCIISNPSGSVTSNSVLLTVNALPPVITEQPINATITEGSPVMFSLTVSGTPPFAYQWFKDGATITGADQSSLDITPSISDDSAQFTCSVTNSAGTVLSSVAVLTVNPLPVPPSITQQPLPVAALTGSSVIFSVEALGTAPFTYQWLKDNIVITGATQNLYTIENALIEDNGSLYSCIITNVAGFVTSNSALLTVNASPPFITQQPLNDTVTEGTSAIFSLTVSGTGPFEYKWFKNGAEISGAVQSALSITPAILDNLAEFTCTVTNSVGSVTSSTALLIVNVAPVSPFVTQQPVPVSVLEGSEAIFTVVVSGTDPFVYQWLKNGIPISGATQSIYTISSTSISDNNKLYSCIISNEAGSVISDEVMLTVSPVLPSIIQQPNDVSVTENAPVTFSITVSGTAPFTYQWFKNNVAITGATQESYTITSTYYSDNNSLFKCSVSNSAGTVITQEAILTVNPVLPFITQQPLSLTVTEGNTATFSVSVSGTAPFAYQWRKNGIDIPGATLNTYTTPVSLLSDNNSQFNCAIINPAGLRICSTAVLTVNPVVVTPVNGLTGRYYKNVIASFSSTVALTRIDANINFYWLAAAPDPVVGADKFAIRWTGKIQPAFSQTYTFYTQSDDGIRLWVNDVLLIDKWVYQGVVEHSGSIALTAGVKYNIKIEYFDGNGNAVCKLFWKSNSVAKQIVPSANLFPESNLREGDLEGEISYDTETNENALNVYPTLTDNILCIDNALNGIKYEIISSNGVSIKQGEVTSTHECLNVEYLASGTYFIRIGEQTKLFLKR